MYVQIDKDGLKPHYWSTKHKTYICEPASSKLSLLSCRCELNPTLTVKGFISCIRKEQELVEFFKIYSHCDQFDAYVKELDKLTAEEEQGHFVQFLWVCQINSNQLNLFPSMNIVDQAGNSFGFVNTPLNKTKNMRLVLSKHVSFVAEYDPEEAVDSSRNFKLLDVLHAFFWEISFFGKVYTEEYMKRFAPPSERK